MSNSDLNHIREAINRTLSQPGAFFHVETRAEGVLSSSHGTVNFQNVAYTSKDTFTFSGSEMGEEEQIEGNEVISLFHQGVIFHQMEVDDQEKQWTAFETGDSGWDSSNLAPLFWLEGVEQVTMLGPSHYQLSINMQQYIAKKPTASERNQAIQTLENSVVGLSTKILSCKVKVDVNERIEWLAIAILMGNPSQQQDSPGEEGQRTRTTISLSFLETPPTILKPEVNQRFSANEFIKNTIEQGEQELAEKKKEKKKK